MKTLSGLVLLLSCCMLTVEAKVVDMGERLGKVVNAEITSADINLIGRDNLPWPVKFAQPLYVTVVLKLHSGRTLSLLDYRLNVNGHRAECAAVLVNSGYFVVNPDPVTAYNDDLVRLLFVYDSRSLKPSGGKYRAQLESYIPQRKTVTFMLNDLGKKEFTEPDKIPAAGLLK